MLRLSPLGCLFVPILCRMGIVLRDAVLDEALGWRGARRCRRLRSFLLGVARAPGSGCADGNLV